MYTKRIVESQYSLSTSQHTKIIRSKFTIASKIQHSIVYITIHKRLKATVVTKAFFEH